MKRTIQGVAVLSAIATAIFVGAFLERDNGASPTTSGTNHDLHLEASPVAADEPPSDTDDSTAAAGAQQGGDERRRSRNDSMPPTATGEPTRPWAHNTGPSDPEALIASGPLNITTDGTVLENLDITGMVKIDADNVTIRNFRIASTSRYGIRIVDGHEGILFEDGEIFGMDSAAILGVGFTARRLHIHDTNGDGLKVQGVGGPTLVESSFIEKTGADGEGHCDGNQTRGGSNITFRGNNIYMPYPGTPSYVAPYKSNATFMLELDISNFVIEGNWLTGGNYTIYCRQDGHVTVRNNIFGRENAGLAEGKEALRIRAGHCDVWKGNRWEDGGPI